MITRVLVLVFAALALPCLAQVRGPSAALAWRGGFPVRWFSDARRLEREIFDSKGHVITRSLVLPDGPRYSLGWGEIWQINGFYKISRSEDGVAWIEEGRLVADSLPHQWIPLGEGRLLAGGFKSPLVLDDAASSMGVFKRDSSGNYRLDSLIQPLKHPLFRREGKAFVLNEKVGYFDLHNLYLQELPFRALPIGALFVSLWSGQVWQFDEQGRISRTHQIFDRPREDEWPDILMFEPAMLGLQVMMDGRVLVASRTMDAVTEARRNFPVAIRKNGKMQLAGDAVTSYSNQLNAGFLYPRILWWELNPSETGLRRLENPPPGSPAELPGSPEEAQAWIQAFTFVVDRAGELRLIKP